jgi:hypothetical protein
MTLLEQHLAFVESQVGVCVYILGGEGQKVDEAYIKAHSSGDHEKDALALYRKLKAAGIKNVLCWDCSGLITEDLIDKGVISGDKTANGLLKICTIIDKSKVYPGCLCFRVTDSDKDGKNEKSDHGHHVGEVTKMVDGVPWVTEAKGHAYGVVCKPVNHYGKGYWEIFGVPSYLGKMGGVQEDTDMLLKKGDNNEHVARVQRALIALGRGGEMNPAQVGEFGTKTQNAVIEFQKAFGLPPAGEVDNDTFSMLLAKATDKIKSDEAYIGGILTAVNMKR